MSIDDRLEDLATEVKYMREELHEEKFWRNRMRVAAGVSIIIMLLAIGFGSWTTVRLIGLAEDNKSLSTDTKAILTLFGECTTPGTAADPHECFEAGQANQQAAVERIRDDTTETLIAVISCFLARSPDVRACVDTAEAGTG